MFSRNAGPRRLETNLFVDTELGRNTSICHRGHREERIDLANREIPEKMERQPERRLDFQEAKCAFVVM